MKRIMLVFGTRPEAIKMCPLVNRLKLHKDNFDVMVCVTGQHREMLLPVLDFFNVHPDINLDIMSHGQDLFDVTTRAMLGLRDVMKGFNPDLVLVHGDTSTTFAASLSAFYQKIPVCHIEAGLRTNDIYSPWPEEINRQLTSRIASFHFAPTELNKENLLKEGVDPEKIFVTGNTVIDALFDSIIKIDEDEIMKTQILEIFDEKLRGILSDDNKKIVLITGHRRENFGEGFNNIFRALKQLSLDFNNVTFIYPLHMNPNIKNSYDHVLDSACPGNLFLVNPLDYVSFIYLMKRAYIILTDSGGIQEEAPSLNKPVLVMRNNTERQEAVTAGTVKLVGTKESVIYEEVSKLLLDSDYYTSFVHNRNPYGDGTSSDKIVEILKTI